MDTRHVGNFAEDYACDLLIANGYKILDRNFRIRVSEIDIIAQKEDTLVFVEVKARWNNKFGKPEEAVNFLKLKKIMKAGIIWKLKHPKSPAKQRVDVVSLVFENKKCVSARIIKVF